MHELYVELLPTLKKIQAKAVERLESAVSESDLKIHYMSSRIKEWESLRKKVIRDRPSAPLYDVHDILGIRVVCLLREDLSKIDTIVKSTFDLAAPPKTVGGLTSDRFGYRAVHYRCRIPTERANAEELTARQIVFEIQVRTPGQDAWAAVEHHLQYKGQYSIPDHMRPDIYAIAGLFDLADKTFQRIYESAQQVEAEAKEIVEPIVAAFSSNDPVEDHPDINLDQPKLKALLRAKYPRRANADNSDYSEFVESLASVNIRGVRQLLALLRSGEEAALETEASAAPGDEDEAVTEFWDVGFARESVYEASSEFRELVDREFEDLLRRSEEVHQQWVQ
ncbi:MAG: hypothetical protein CK428_30045 [Mycobacterium sp.]|nr:MAG: hypothetical protein CK428_30045 [Mycobacterium sp.]